MNGLAAKIKGIVVPLITPLTKARRIDKAATQRLISHVLKSGIHGIYILGSAGEGPCLLEREKQKLAEMVVMEVNGRVPVIMGSGDCSTERAIENTKTVREIGADAAAIVAPYYFRLSNRELANYYRQIAEEVDLPILIYNYPQATGICLEPYTVKQIAQTENIIGIKDSSGDFPRFQELLYARKNLAEFIVLQGNDSLILSSLMSGADGAVPGLANVVPNMCVSIYDTLQNGDFEKAYDLQEQLNSIMHTVYHECRSAQAGVKGALYLMSICGKTTTRPLPELNRREIERVKEKIRQFDII